MFIDVTIAFEKIPTIANRTSITPKQYTLSPVHTKYIVRKEIAGFIVRNEIAGCMIEKEMTLPSRRSDCNRQAQSENEQKELNPTNKKLRNIQRYTPITVYQTAPFQTRKILIDLVISW